MTARLQVRGIEKSFGGVQAVRGVSFDVHEGEILGVIGPNGSGKSTLFNCILGQLVPSRGSVSVDGRDVTGLRPSELNRLGVSRTFQLLQVFPRLTARENLILAGQEHRGSRLGRLFGATDAGLGAEADRMLEFFRLDALAGELAGSLSYGQQKLLDAAQPVFDRVLDRDDLLLAVVDLLQGRIEGRRLAGSGRTGEQDQSRRPVQGFVQERRIVYTTGVRIILVRHNAVLMIVGIGW